MTALTLLAIVCVIIGIVGTILPGLPGTTLVLGGLVLAAYADDFARVGWGTLAVLGGLTVLSVGVDFLATMLGAKRVGASRLAIIGAALGTFAGLALGIVGVLIGPFIGAVAGEMIHRGRTQQQTVKDSVIPASKVGIGAWLGLLVGAIAKLLIVAIMIGLFVLVYFKPGV